MKKTFLMTVLLSLGLRDGMAQIDHDESGIWKYASLQTDLSLFQSNYNALESKPLPKFTLFPSFTLYDEIYSREKFGIQVGVSIKNMGFRWKTDSLVHTRKLSGIGIPVLFRFGENHYLGNGDKEYYAFVGGQMDFLFHQKQVVEVNGSKLKDRTFLPDDVNLWQPSVFVGINKPVVSFKLTMYPRNLLSTHQYNSQVASFSVIVEPISFLIGLTFLGAVLYQYS